MRCKEEVTWKSSKPSKQILLYCAMTQLFNNMKNYKMISNSLININKLKFQNIKSLFK